MKHPTRQLSLAAALVLAAGSISAARQAPQVRLKYATFDPMVSLPAVPDSLRAEQKGRLWLVQFAGTPTEAMREEVRRRGGEVLRFATDHTHLVRIPAGAIESLRKMPAVRWVGPYHPAYRVDPAILAGLLHGLPEHGGSRYSIEVLEERGVARTALAIARSGGLVEHAPSTGIYMEATLTSDQLLNVLRLDDVNFVDPTGPPGADMDIVRQLVGAVPVLSSAGFTGRGVRGEVFDTTIDVAHPAFQNPPPLLHFPVSTGDGHGSAVYGIIFGNGAGNPAATGLLPDREQGIFCPYTVASTFGGSVTNRDLISHLVNPTGPYRAVFQSRAVGSVQVTNYNTISALMDDATFEHDFLICQSMGNTGTFNSRPEAWAKNIMGCGGVDHQNTLARADDTGGPNISASDGRYKPDMVAPNDEITSTSPGGLYTQFAGTSASTGIMAGCFGLVHQMWHEGVWAGFGGGASVFADRPHLSTVRALVINSAYQYNWLSGPNIQRGAQGWGMPDLAALYAARGRMRIINETDPLTPQSTRTYTMYVLPGEPALKVTMVYLDPPGNPAAAQARINDLSLKVVSPTGATYWGNFGLRNSIWSPSGGAANTVDVVENVFLQAPETGDWTILVIGTEIVQDARVETPELDADFALVVTGASCYANCDGSSIPPVLNANDFQCFLDRFVAGELYANCDGSTEPPILNANDFQCFIDRFVGTCP